MDSQPQPDPAQTNATAERLAAALEDMTQELARTNEELAAAKKASEDRDAALARYGRHNRTVIIADVVITVLLAVLALWTGSISGRASSASAKAASASAAASALRTAQIAGCENGNQYRAGVVASLDRLVFLLEGPHPSAKTRAAADAYERYVLSQNMPRDCVAAYPLTPAKGSSGGAS